MTTIVIADGHILVDNKLYVSLDFEAYVQDGGIGIRYINQKDLILIKGRVLPSEISLNGTVYPTAVGFVYAFNAHTAPALSYLLTGMRSDVTEIASRVEYSETELKRISGHANSGMQQFLQITDTALHTLDFFALMAMNADAVIEVITNTDVTSALAYFSNATAYRDRYYPGRFASIKLTSGIVTVYLDEQ